MTHRRRIQLNKALRASGLRRRVEVTPRASILTCPFCRDELNTLAQRACAGCDTAYHAVCMAELAGCTTVGCDAPKFKIVWSESTDRDLWSSPLSELTPMDVLTNRVVQVAFAMALVSGVGASMSLDYGFAVLATIFTTILASTGMVVLPATAIFPVTVINGLVRAMVRRSRGGAR